MAVAFFVAWDGRPLSPTGYESVGSIYLWLWILVQTLCLMLPALGLLIFCAALNTKHACGKHCAVLVNVYFLSIPVVLVFDGLIFHWIGQRLFSANFANGMGDFARLPSVRQQRVSDLVRLGRCFQCWDTCICVDTEQLVGHSCQGTDQDAVPGFRGSSVWFGVSLWSIPLHECHVRLDRSDGIPQFRAPIPCLWCVANTFRRPQHNE